MSLEIPAQPYWLERSLSDNDFCEFNLSRLGLGLDGSWIFFGFLSVSVRLLWENPFHFDIGCGEAIFAYGTNGTELRVLGAVIIFSCFQEVLIIL